MVVTAKAMVLKTGIVERGVDACLLRPAFDGADGGAQRMMENIRELSITTEGKAFLEEGCSEARLSL